MTLPEALNTISYERQWGVWAQKIDGKFVANSSARIGKRLYENGGMDDDMTFVCDGERPKDFCDRWENTTDPNAKFQSDPFWIEAFLDEINEELEWYEVNYGS